MTDKKTASITLDCKLSGWDSTVSAALELAQVWDYVSIDHNGVSVCVHPDWTPKEVEAAWHYSRMLREGKGLTWWSDV